MPNDIEKRVLEQTRRNRSEISSLMGNLVKVEREDGKRVNGEKDVKNPILAVLAIAGGFGVIWFIAYIITVLEKVFVK